MAKRLLVAYGLWALGGPLGLHHIYLGRDSHALLWMLTLGGFGGGWLWDFWHLPGWVAAANGAGVPRGPQGPAPSPLRLVGQVVVGMYFGLAAALGLPWVPALLAQPLAVGLGVQLVSSVGDQTAEAPSTLAAAFLTSLLFQGRVLAVLPTSLAASLVAHRHRRYKPGGMPRPRLAARLYHLGLACLAFAAPLACRGLSITAGVLGTILALPRATIELLLLPLRATRLLAEILGFTSGSPARERGAGLEPSSWSQRQQQAYEVLGLPVGSSAEDVHRSYRELVKVWHPDHNRHRGEEAERRFIQLQEAYEELVGPRRAAGG
ncbi:LOW QUALITY PROTEIN: dnaJ homolog subfamily C member 22 [Falco biarmicus]|uniref:LOW QUALITY PROTEIN: dnaJ homolog subfamily C member 22 n=1 Tax=Falco cherrug TaxID=345164 RepID=UPI001886AA25|nr:dnaJ homolog subfamily C member 22 isoform X2 [Falco rusticolus]XP_055552875.1 LOW QUALITY PROTEIN: dnaJ homolog subfamily C member 22 [Falco cherrug]XP_056178380.1 LOW QUALITY PROTEIN: dnaJ homolog subfamily C member 22 [Falco biarmicus]